MIEPWAMMRPNKSSEPEHDRDCDCVQCDPGRDSEWDDPVYCAVCYAVVGLGDEHVAGCPEIERSLF